MFLGYGIMPEMLNGFRNCQEKVKYKKKLNIKEKLI